MMRTAWNFHSAGQLVFGRGSCAQLGSLLSRRKLRRVFVVTDPRLQAAGLVERASRPLRESGIAVELFTGGEPEPAIGTAVKAAAAARQFGPDGVLGLGGGSNMDLAKIVAVLLAHGGEAREYFGFDNVPGPIAPPA